MTITTNQKVKTPFGDGVVQGFFAVHSRDEQVVTGVAVRLPVNDLTRPELNKSNCLTPLAVFSGVWVFKQEQLQ